MSPTHQHPVRVAVKTIMGHASHRHSSHSTAILACSGGDEHAWGPKMGRNRTLRRTISRTRFAPYGRNKGLNQQVVNLDETAYSERKNGPLHIPRYPGSSWTAANLSHFCAKPSFLEDWFVTKCHRLGVGPIWPNLQNKVRPHISRVIVGTCGAGPNVPTYFLGHTTCVTSGGDNSCASVPNYHLYTNYKYVSLIKVRTVGQVW